MKKIPLTQGKFAIVDDEDFEKYSKFKWHFQHGYARRFIVLSKINGKQKNKLVTLHREIIGAKKGQQADHVDGNRLDCRKENLRICTPQQNAMNRCKPSNNTSGYKGVSYIKRLSKWVAQIGTNKYVYGKKHLGVFDTKEEARDAYQMAEKEYFKEFARVCE